MFFFHSEKIKKITSEFNLKSYRIFHISPIFCGIPRRNAIFVDLPVMSNQVGIDQKFSQLGGMVLGSANGLHATDNKGADLQFKVKENRIV
jgi:hypothetical protein